MGWRVWIEPKPSGKFLVRRRDNKGNNLPAKSCSTKHLANQIMKRWGEELELFDLGIQNPKRDVLPLWEEYRNELEKADQVEYAMAMDNAIPHYIQGKKSVSDMTEQSVQAYRTHLINTVATATVKSRLRHLAAWLGWCCRKKYLTRNPFVNIDIPDYTPQPKFLTPDEIQKLDDAATGDLKLAWRLAYTTGLRQRNIRTLHGDMIEGDVAIIPRTKGKKPIMAPLDPEVLELLPKPLPPGPLFPRYDGDGRWNLQRDFNDLKKAAGVREDATWHHARHTFVKDALQAGLTTFEVMTYTGHVSPIAMKPYAHFEGQRLRERHRLIRTHRKKKMVGR